MNNKRYFLISFSGLSEENTLRTGKIEYRTHDGKFANEKILLTMIGSQFELEQVFIKQIQELPESDFMDWIEGRENTPPELPESSGDDGGFL